MAQAMSTYTTLDCTQAGGVLKIRMRDRRSMPVDREHDIHEQLYQAFHAARIDDEVRVIVLTGTERSFSQTKGGLYEEDAYIQYRLDGHAMWATFASIVRLHECMAAIEKPIIARVNGPAIGFGSSLVFSCDLIVSAEDAVIADPHLGPAANQKDKTPGVVPGDGGAALIPLFLSPAKAKEYLMLGAPIGSAELARLGVINYAVPFEKLDETVDGLAAQLLTRPAHALARTKRLVNRSVMDGIGKTLDAAAAYEMVDFLQWGRDGRTQSVKL
jgi:enoyl-CoA hydratase